MNPTSLATASISILLLGVAPADLARPWNDRPLLSSSNYLGYDVVLNPLDRNTTVNTLAAFFDPGTSK